MVGWFGDDGMVCRRGEGVWLGKCLYRVKLLAYQKVEERMCDAGFIGRIITASQPQPPRARNSRVEEYSYARFSHGFFCRSTRADQVRLMSVAYLHPTPPNPTTVCYRLQPLLRLVPSSIQSRSFLSCQAIPARSPPCDSLSCLHQTDKRTSAPSKCRDTTARRRRP